MSKKIYINDLDQKIELVLRSELGTIRTNNDLLHALDISKDYLSRIKSGLRVLTEEKFISLCHICNIEQKNWYLPLFEFGLQLGFTRKQIASITRTPLPGIDFSSRIKDRQMIEDIFELIEGFWESYYFSVSNLHEIVVRKDLLCVDNVNEDGFIECRVVEDDIFYKGVCFPIKSQLMFILEKEKIYNEIITYCTNLPERTPPMLYGVLLCLSGGVHDVYTYPAAAKVAFRYIGNRQALKKKYPEMDIHSIEEMLRKNFCGYLYPSEVKDPDILRLLQNISNVVKENDIPSAITMKKSTY